MTIGPILEKCLTDWHNTSGMDFCLLNESFSVFVSTCSRPLPAENKLAAFFSGDALVVSNTSVSFYKIHEGRHVSYILLVWGGRESASVIGELCVLQIESLLTAYTQKNDRNLFMQNVLLDVYSHNDLLTQARKMHISIETPRVVLLVETRQSSDSALTMLKSLFASRSKDFILSMEGSGIAIIHELAPSEDYADLHETAHMIVDMLGAEAMTGAWVSYSNISSDLVSLANAYKEARTSLEVGKIFYAHKSVFGYSRLGIGRLIYQIPVSVCEIFLNEIFGEGSLDDLDEETMNTIRTFFANNLNLSETSRQMFVHRNTMVYRFEKLQKRYGLDIRTFEDALTFKLAMMVSDYVKYHNH